MGFVIYFVVVFIILLLNQLVVILHEIGHALAATLLTNSTKIDVLIGTQKENKAQINFKFFIYHFHLRFDIFGLHGGGVIYNKSGNSILKEAIILLSGSSLSLIVSIFLFILFQNNIEKYPFLRILSIFLILANLKSIYENFFKNSTNIFNYWGGNDGEQLEKLMKYGKDFIRVQDAFKAYLAENYNECELLLIEANKNVQNIDIIRYLAYSTHNQKKYSESENYLEELENKYTFNDNDYLFRIINWQHLNRNDEIIEFFNNIENAEKITQFVNVNNIIAYCYLEKEMFDDAIIYCEKALQDIPNDFSTLINNGYCNLKLGFLEKGYKHLLNAEKINSEDANLYSNISYYYCCKKEKDLAVQNLTKAKKLGLIQEDCNELEELIKKL
jgi:hypothetical protein